MPVILSPTGVQAVHPDGEVAVARAAAARGVPLGLSSFASKPIDEVIAAQPMTLFQTYWAGDREAMLARVDRAESAGACGLILTPDWSFVHSRDWGSPKIPQAVDLRTAVEHAAGGPRATWLAVRLVAVRSAARPDGPQLQAWRRRRGSSKRTARGWRRRRRRGTTWRGCGSTGRDRSWSRASVAPTKPAGPSMPVRRPSPSPTTAATTSTARRRRSGCCPRWRRRSATRSRS